jgi:hypothetical protein
VGFRNIDDSGWIPLERVTAFVGRNESGKTAILKALHKFNPATPEPYNPQREFPRDRFTRDFKNGRDWPVCAVEFELSTTFRATLRAVLGMDVPSSAVCTRNYDGSLDISYDLAVSDDSVLPTELAKALDAFSKAARRLVCPSPEQEEQTQEIRSSLISWALAKSETIAGLEDLKNPAGVQVLKAVRDEINARSNPQTADIIETLQDSVEALLQRAQTEPVPDRLDAAIEEALPVFIYFENYGILDSAVYLPRFLEDLARLPNEPKIRTINSMFKHVGLEAKAIAELGREEAAEAKQAGQPVTDEMIRRDQERKELRAVKTNSASLDITRRFSEWFHQRRHSIRYHADGAYFRIWISDDRRPGVEIELESRSKGFQWFFSFYLVFLVESDEGHKDAVLLLDEPGLNLHPTAQQELIGFFEELAGSNMLLYSTHSPFLIDGEHIHRVRPVTEDATGHSRITVDGWPRDRETIFPLQAAAGYAMVRGLFQYRKNVLVEGMADYLLFAMVANRALDPGSKLAVESWVADEAHVEGLRRSTCISCTARWTSCSRRMTRSSGRCSGASPTSSTWRSTCSSWTPPRPTSRSRARTRTSPTDDARGWRGRRRLGGDEVVPGLRKRGHSKDSRPGLAQVVIGFAVTRDGIPVRCWVWPGTPPT